MNYILTYYSLYKLNKDYLVSEKCEMVVEDCNACCYLNKKVAEQSEENNTSENKIITLTKLADYNISDFFNLHVFSQQISYVYVNTVFSNQSYISDIFQPPRA
jgi:hypothetical protein